MAIRRVNLRNQYNSGEIWSDAGNETAALQEVREWCEENPPWEIRSLGPEHGEDGHYKFVLVRAFTATA